MVETLHKTCYIMITPMYPFVSILAPNYYISPMLFYHISWRY